MGEALDIIGIISGICGVAVSVSGYFLFKGRQDAVNANNDNQFIEIKNSIKMMDVKIQDMNLKHNSDMKQIAESHNLTLKEIHLEFKEIAKIQQDTNNKIHDSDTKLQLMSKDLNLVSEFKEFFHEMFGINGRLNQMRKNQ